jgi:hypothetical protein
VKIETTGKAIAPLREYPRRRLNAGFQHLQTEAFEGLKLEFEKYKNLQKAACFQCLTPVKSSSIRIRSLLVPECLRHKHV